ncbi:hypothetical protein GCM10010277_03710 [Streptomyces longisporoflavus]|uniref:hypothetical protein n=1 Tax=Streptomyces longisporoflavus TaxID=28044 RepID=UPI00167DBD4E|nr:hypothetical protein [Streptomyces longisporoflavus]GGV23858.1 hypothetical protein GCM10010277_03710 [Streptomyces longisporoflavus]
MTKPASAPAPAPNAECEGECDGDEAPHTARHFGAGSCRCACDTHPEFPGACRGHAEPGLTAAFDAPAAGARQVPLCRNCHDIRMGLAPQRDSDLQAVTEAVTATCTCHCRANHPARPGICEAASDDRATIGGQPVCRECADAGRGH